MQHANTKFDKLLLQSDTVQEFKDDGVVCLRNALSAEEVEGLKSDVNALMSRSVADNTGYDFEELQRQLWRGEDLSSSDIHERFDLDMYQLVLETDPEVRPITDSVEDNEKGMFFYDAGQWRFHKGIQKAAFESKMPQIAAELLDSKYINFWEDTVFVKTPQTAQRTTFHQDWAYFQISGEKCCIFWIPLDDVTRENGAMEYIRGSHLWDKVYAPNLLVTQSIDPTSPYEKLPDIEKYREKYDIISFDVKPGDVIVHHVKTVHGSGGNKSKTNMRRACAFRYCGDDIRYFEKPGAIEQPYITEGLPNGSPLVSSDYPLVYGQM